MTPDKPSPPSGDSRLAGWVPRLAVLLMLCLAGVLFTFYLADAGGDSGAVTEKDFARLQGRWERTDGGYVLELRTLGPDGTVDAGYFNPRPIHVAEARVTSAEGKLRLAVKLEDEGYAGSRYDLRYEPGSDRLAGVYHQLPSGQDFDVEFVRLPNP